MLKLKFKKIQNEPDLGQVYEIRKKVLVEEQLFPEEAIIDVADKNAAHFLTLKENSVVGAVSAILDSEEGLPLEKFFNISAYKDKKSAQVYRLVVLPEERNKLTFLTLMMVAYEFVKKYAKKIFIIVEQKHLKHVKLFKKLGFKSLGKCSYGNLGEVEVMLLDIEKDAVFEKEEFKLKERVLRSVSDDFN